MMEGEDQKPSSVQKEDDSIWLRQGLDEELTNQCVDLLINLELKKISPKITVIWNPRMRSTAGRAFWKEFKIELNPWLNIHAPDQVQRTLLHELAHIIAHTRADRARIAPHGAEWRQACAELGIPNEAVTHSLPLPSRKMERRWKYQCPVCGEGFDRVKRMKRQVACYTCCKKHNRGHFHKKYKLLEVYTG